MGLGVHQRDHADRIKALFLRLRFGKTRTAYIQSRQMAHSRAQHAAIANLLAHHVLGDDAARDIGGGAHRRPGRLAGDGVAHHRAVTSGIDIRIVGLAELIGEDRALEHLDARIGEERGIGTNARAHYDQIGLVGLLAGEHLGHLAVLALDAGNRHAGDDRDARLSELALDILGALRIKARQHMLGHIQHKRLHAVGLEVFRDLETDVACADDNSASNAALRNDVAQRDRILRRTHEEHIFKIHTRDRRVDWARARGNNQLIVSKGFLLAGGKIYGSDLLGSTINLRRLHAHKHLCSGQAFVLCRGIDDQLFFLLDHMAHVIRKAAARVGNILALIQDHNFIAAVFAHELGRNLGAGSNAAQNNDLHSVSPSRVKPAFLY